MINHPPEPFRIKMVEPIEMLDRSCARNCYSPCWLQLPHLDYVAQMLAQNRS